ncbi:MAG: acyltransferase domain-containing protein [Gemmatimonadetes bacterium]|nr:acyltransferase domain-containing protein [Gemmatimonadota bacterium]
MNTREPVETVGSRLPVACGDPPPQAIAIVGMACRFPGADDLDEFWDRLEAGTIAVAEGCPNSGPGRHAELCRNAIDHAALRHFGFVSGIDEFDAEFFRIAPVEAQLLDPQQRLLLETGWEALEDAGIDPGPLEGSSTGVYVGISNNDYGEMIPRVRGVAPSLYAITGNCFSTASGRIAYVLGLNGPALAIDTACSSSLVAVHQAVVALQRGEADLALVGGVSALLAPPTTEAFAGAGMLSPTGRCWTFDEAADGFVRGEGCGVVVLRRLEEARAAGDRIWAVIRGSAVNQDGSSEGLWVPDGPAQERVIAEALRRAGLPPSSVDYVEAHGTGTKVGDPIELRALSGVYGQGRESERPLLVGSVKTNIGHLSAAAGVAGLIKVVLAMNRGALPRHLNFRNPTSRVDWSQLPIRVVAEPVEWRPVPGRPVRAGINSFGFSGTNAHVIVESQGAPGRVASNGASWPPGGRRTVRGLLGDAPAGGATTGQRTRCERRSRFLPLSARSGAALQELATRHLSRLERHFSGASGDGADTWSRLSDLAWTAGAGRSHFAHRAGVAFHDLASLRRGLAEVAEPSNSTGPAGVPTVAFLYTGQASQWVGMGHALYETEPVARDVLDECDRLMRKDRGASLLDVMSGREGPVARLDNPAWTQPAIYALECALTALWRSFGVRPDVVLGHSLGELAAAEAAGVFTLLDGLRFAAARGGLIETLPAVGAMAAIFAAPEEVSRALEEYNEGTAGPGLSVAAYNGAHQVISGLAADVEAVAKHFEAGQARVRRLRTTQGYHSALLEPVLDALATAARVPQGVPAFPRLVSNLTGRVAAPGELLDGEYWRRQAREPVAFAEGVQTLAGLGVDVIVEIGPHSVLGPMAALAWPDGTDDPDPPVVLSSLQRPSAESSEAETETDPWVSAAAGAYTGGVGIDFTGLFHGESRRRISLPSYPFQRRRHWIEAPKRDSRRSPVNGRSLLGARHESPTGEVRFEAQLTGGDPDWLGDHLVFGRVMVPCAAYAAMAASALMAEGAESIAVEDAQLYVPLILPSDGEDDNGRVELVMSPSRGGKGQRVETYSRGGGEEGWVRNMSGTVSGGAPPPDAEAPVELGDLRARMSPVDVPSLYRAKARKRVDLGPAFQVLRRVWAAPGESLAEVALSRELAEAGLDVHPVLLDGCFQAGLAARNQAGGEVRQTYLPFGWDHLWLAGKLPDRVWCHVRMRDGGVAAADDANGRSQEALKADLRLYSAEGEMLGVVDGFTFKRATPAALWAGEGLRDTLYEVVWRDGPLAGDMRSADFLPAPNTIAADAAAYSEYLIRDGVEPTAREVLLEDLEWLSRGYALAALDELGWERQRGADVSARELRHRLRVAPNHVRLLARMLDLLADGGVLERTANGRLTVTVGAGDPPPHESLADPDSFAASLEDRHPSGSIELALLRRCGNALAEVLRARVDPLELLFADGRRGAADLYRTAPATRAANRMLSDVVAALRARLPEGRRLRVIEVGAGTGGSTEWVRARLPAGRFDYCYTDISAGFFSNAQGRFGGEEADMRYRVLNIERDPVAQGFDPHAHDLVIASNVLHATRDLAESLAHCRRLLAPSGQLLMLESLRRRGWQDLTFGQLEGWWRFADRYRSDHALVDPETWMRALRDAGFVDGHVLGEGDPREPNVWDRGVILATRPAEATDSPGVWVLVTNETELAADLARRLASRGQTVVLAGGASDDAVGPASRPGVTRVSVNAEARASWRSLIKALPRDQPLAGVVHLAALEGHGPEATTEQLATDSERVVGSVLGLTQGLLDTGVTPSRGFWIVTRGAQVLERERHGHLAGALLWGFGKAAGREAAHLRPRMVDLDPLETGIPSAFADELLSPDPETHIAYRAGRRRVARLVRARAGTPRLELPGRRGWRLERDRGGSLANLQVDHVPSRPLSPRDVRVSVEAAGLNFRDVLRAMGALGSGLLGRELCGRVVETGSEVAGLAPGDRVVGLGFGTFAPEVTTRAELLARAPDHLSASALATVPTVFVSAAICFELARLEARDRVLIHAGAGGVGLAAIQWAVGLP